MFEISDELGNNCIVESKDLACMIVKDKSTPFVNIVELKDEVKGRAYHQDYGGLYLLLLLIGGGLGF